MTDSGRTVYGGGGISPDEKFVPEKLNKFQIEALRKFGFFNFSSSYFGGRDSKLPKGWEPDQAVIDQFKGSLKKSGAEFTDQEFTENLPWIKNQLKREMYITAFSIDESLKVAAEIDPITIKAIEALPKAKTLLDSAKKLLVQRMNGQAQTAQAR
jgi:carboxyl-terminal processing protease